MRNKLILIFLLLLGSTVFAQDLKNLDEPVFKVGEKLSYRLRYGFITAAEATIQVKESNVKFEDRPTFHLSAEGRTAGTFNLFYKVKNQYDSYVDQDNMSPYLYTEDIREANYRRSDRVRFYQNYRKIVSKKGTYKTKGQTFDVISAYFFARNLDISKLKEGDKFKIDYFLSDGISTLEIQYLGKERVKSALGTFNCIKFSPSIQPGRIFRKDSKLYLWITDDLNRIPVKAQVEILVGSVTLELEDAEGLKYPLSAIK